MTLGQYYFTLEEEIIATKKGTDAMNKMIVVTVGNSKGITLSESGGSRMRILSPKIAQLRATDESVLIQTAPAIRVRDAAEILCTQLDTDYFVRMELYADSRRKFSEEIVLDLISSTKNETDILIWVIEQGQAGSLLKILAGAFEINPPTSLERETALIIHCGKEDSMDLIE